MKVVYMWAVLAALLGLQLMTLHLHSRLTLVEEKVNRPLGNCLEMTDLTRNRPYPPKHGIHSYAKEVPLCAPSI